MKKLLIVLIVLAVIGLGVNGFSGDGHGGGKSHHGMGMISQTGAYKNMTWFTALTPEKQTAVQKIIDNNDKEITGLRLKMQEKKALLDTMIFEDKTPQKDIDKVVSEINAIRSKLYQTHINIKTALKKAGVPYPYFNFMGMGGGACGKKAGMGMKSCPMMQGNN